MSEFEARKQQLLNRRKELTARLTSIEAELDSHQSKDWEELAVEREEDEVLEGLGDQGLKEDRQIYLALERNEDGTYGECQKCGETIPEALLELLPHTPLSRKSASSL